MEKAGDVMTPHLVHQVRESVGHDALLLAAVGVGDPEWLGMRGSASEQLLGHGGAGGGTSEKTTTNRDDLFTLSVCQPARQCQCDPEHSYLESVD